MWAANSWWKLKVTLLRTLKRTTGSVLDEFSRRGTQALWIWHHTRAKNLWNAFRVRLRRCLSVVCPRPEGESHPDSLTPFLKNITMKANKQHTHDSAWKIHTDCFFPQQLQTYEPLCLALISCFRTLAALKATVSCVGFTLSSVQKAHWLTR